MLKLQEIEAFFILSRNDFDIKKTPTFLLKFFVGDIDLTSNQILDFLETFIENMT
jgi:hypothetical protein